MIFRKLLCGGFGMFISQNDQVKLSCISVLCQNCGLTSAQLNPSWTEPSSKPQRLPSSFDIPNTSRLSLRHPQDLPKQHQTYIFRNFVLRLNNCSLIRHRRQGGRLPSTLPPLLHSQVTFSYFI